MAHFDHWQWADFVRGLSDASSQSMMHAHLTSGCPSCEKTVETLRTVLAHATEEAQYEPPDYAIRYADAVYSIVTPQTKLARLVARLVHDSAREPLAAGLRGMERLSRRALFAAGDYNVDLQLDREPTSDLITLVGQLAGRVQSTSVAGVPVWLMERESLVENTTCNTFGEFQLEYEPRRNLRLLFPLREVGKRLEIALDHLSPGKKLQSSAVPPAGSSRRRKTRGQA